ncbi:hypothetical protein PENFLA_c010G10880 [Penicillium flavigenum]|uniref:Uncharacterized protein n=1 Tax=Penicillium flavigenum TaxID=254877 RepID=A0A1V6TD51_9EURO|nr:hypothetical protein PENFLA_c010G10880 [Penicillium flavigenum]
MDNLNLDYDGSSQRWNAVLTKLNLWKLEEYDKIVFLNVDSVIFRPIYDIFEDPATNMRATVNPTPKMPKNYKIAASHDSRMDSNAQLVLGQESYQKDHMNNGIAQRNGGYTLEWAAIDGSTSTGRRILEAGAPPDACGGEAWQPFALAAVHGHTGIIGLLYEHGVNLNPRFNDYDWKNYLDDEEDVEDREEGHPLSMAASHGHISVVKLLLGYGVRPDLPTSGYEKRTGLHLASEQGYLDVVRVLANAGSAINTQDGHGKTPLAFAATGHLDIVQFVLSRRADPNITAHHTGTWLCMAFHSDGQKPLFQLSRAAQGGHDDIVDLLLTRFDHVQSSTEPYQQPVLLCVAALNRPRYTPHRPADKTKLRPQPPSLAWAAERNQPVAIDILLFFHGARITPRTDNDDEPRLIRAITEGHKEAVATLLAHGANPSNNPPPGGKTLCRAIPNPLSLLLSHKADPTIYLPKPNPPRPPQGSRASRRPNIDRKHHPATVDPAFPSRGGEGTLCLLLDRGLVTPPEELDDHIAGGYLDVAAQHGEISLMRGLVYRGATATKGLLDFFREDGCSIDGMDDTGQTAFFMAICDGNEVAMRRVLERGAKPLVECCYESALSVAVSKNHIGVVRVILGAYDERALDLGKVERPLKRAEERALEEDVLEGDQKDDRSDIVRLLRQFYWRTRYPVCN